MAEKLDRLEKLLGPDEKVLWEGRPVRYPLSWGWLVGYALAIAFFVWNAWHSYRSMLEHGPVAVEFKPWGSIHFTRPGPLPFATGPIVVDAAVPNPGLLIVAYAFIELVRVSLWRARRLAITTTRVLHVSWRGSLEEVPRAGATGTIVKHDLVVRNGAKTLRLPGLADPEAALSALRA